MFDIIKIDFAKVNLRDTPKQIFLGTYRDAARFIGGLVDEYRRVCREWELPDPQKLRAELDYASTPEMRDALTRKAHDADAIRLNGQHPAHFAARNAKFAVWRKIAAAAVPFLAAGDDCVLQLHAQADADEKALYGIYGEKHTRSHIHGRIAHLEMDIKRAREVFARMMTPMSVPPIPLLIAELGTPLPAWVNPLSVPGVNVCAVDPRIRRVAMDVGWNAEEANRVAEKEKRTAQLTVKAQVESKEKRAEIRRAKARAAARPFIPGVVHQTVAPDVEVSSAAPSSTTPEELAPGVGDEEVNTFI